MTRSIPAKIERISNNQVVIKTADNQTLNWPAQDFDPKYTVGSSVWLMLSPEKDTQATAKAMLNQILKTDDQG